MDESIVVSGVIPDAGRAGAVRIEVGGRPFCTIAAAVARRLGLARGTSVSAAARDELQAAADVEAALRSALRALERRGFAREDLGRRLIRKGHPATAVAQALDQADALGLLDDRSFAQQFAAARADRGQGPARIRLDLRSRGVADEIVEAVLAEAFPTDEAVEAMVLRLAEKRAAQLGGLPRTARRRRLLAYLARRGFAGHEVLATVERLTAEDAPRRLAAIRG